MYITTSTYKIYLKNKEVVDLGKESIGITCVILSFLVSIKLLLNKRLKVKRKTANKRCPVPIPTQLYRLGPVPVPR